MLHVQHTRLLAPINYKKMKGLLKTILYSLVLLLLSCNVNQLETCNCNELKSINDLVLYKNIPFSGTCQAFYVNGNLQSSTEYLDGVFHGWYKTFYSNSSPKGKVKHVNGYRRGFYDYYDSIPNILNTRYEFIRPTEIIRAKSKPEDEYKWNGFLNRVWHYFDEDTTVVSTSSNAYTIKPINNGIKISYHFSNQQSYMDTSYLLSELIIGDFDKPNFNYDTTRIDSINKMNYYIYQFSKKDIQNGFVKGFFRIFNCYAERNSENKFEYPMNCPTRDLFFNWSIKNNKLDNY
tara:strand:- start:55 stop:927 length:873 start_codon:yes stop_codon:yes gene_type:complete